LKNLILNIEKQNEIQSCKRTHDASNDTNQKRSKSSQTTFTLINSSTTLDQAERVNNINTTGLTRITVDEGDSPRQFNLQKIGTYKSRGACDGRPVYKGPQGGLFYLGINGYKSYIQSGFVVYNSVN